MRVDDLDVEDGVDVQSYVVFGDGDLCGDVDYLLSEVVDILDLVKERDFKV